MSNELLPIKLVVAQKGDYWNNEPPGNVAFEPVIPVTFEFRQHLATQIDRLSASISKSFAQTSRMPAIAKVGLHNQALAKTKRPTAIFNNRTCPIVGGGDLGKLFVFVTEDRLERLKERVLFGNEIANESHVSTITSIEPYTLTDVIGQDVSLGDLERAAKVGKGFIVRLFDFHNEALDSTAQRQFERLLESRQIRFDALDYSDRLKLYEVETDAIADITRLASLPVIQSVAPVSSYQLVRTAARALEPIPKHLFAAPMSGVRYPTVGVIDSGTDPENPYLVPWIVDRWDVVPRELQDNAHGSFVGGLIINSRAMNHADVRFPSTSARIVDVVAFDRDGRADERDLIKIVKESVKKYPDVKTWNLSFSVSDKVCRNDSFSAFGLVLAELAEEHGVVFVVAAGNVNASGRNWPRTNCPDDDDRICAPADCPTSLTVGSMAHRETAATCVKSEQPSPFSRRGPGTAKLIAPHVAHYGGNCAADHTYAQTGIISIDARGNLAEDVGTSFATPLISSLSANVQEALLANDRPDLLTKAMILHSAFVRNKDLDVSLIDHAGVGVPPDLSDVLYCQQHSATVIFSVDLAKQPNITKQDFPIPSCLVAGDAVVGEFSMTLVYSPPMDPSSGFECCQTNIDAALGTIHPTTGTFQAQVQPFPKFLTTGWEKDLIKNGFKWSPYKFYRRTFDTRNKLAAKDWRLQLKRHQRNGTFTMPESHMVYLLVTLSSPGGSKDPRWNIYDQLIRNMDKLGWGPIDLRLDARVRSRGRT